MTLTATALAALPTEAPPDWTVTFVGRAVDEAAGLLLPTHLFWRVDHVPDPAVMTVGAAQTRGLLPIPLTLTISEGVTVSDDA